MSLRLSCHSGLITELAHKNTQRKTNKFLRENRTDTGENSELVSKFLWLSGIFASFPFSHFTYHDGGYGLIICYWEKHPSPVVVTEISWHWRESPEGVEKGLSKGSGEYGEITSGLFQAGLIWIWMFEAVQLTLGLLSVHTEDFLGWFHL